MSEPKHTPGPWKVVDTEVFGPREFFVLPERDSPAITGGLTGCGRGVEESQANARLISAAPDLLHALRVSEFALRGQKGSELGAWELAVAAIAKAEGRK